MYQCFVRNDYDAVQSTAEMSLGGERLFVFLCFTHLIYFPFALECEPMQRERREMKKKNTSNQLHPRFSKCVINLYHVSLSLFALVVFIFVPMVLFNSRQPTNVFNFEAKMSNFVIRLLIKFSFFFYSSLLLLLCIFDEIPEHHQRPVVMSSLKRLLLMLLYICLGIQIASKCPSWWFYENDEPNQMKK